MANKDDEKDKAGLFIPAGMFLGFGVGYLINNVQAGFFVGMGLGFLAFAVMSLKKK